MQLARHPGGQEGRDAPARPLPKDAEHPSGPIQLKQSVEVLEFDTGIFGCELPVGFGVAEVAITLPGGDFLDECLLVGDAAVDLRAPVVEEPGGPGRRVVFPELLARSDEIASVHRIPLRVCPRLSAVLRGWRSRAFATRLGGKTVAI